MTTMEDLRTLTKYELVEECKKRKISQKGSKNELAVRIFEYINDENAIERDDENGNENDAVQDDNSEDEVSISTVRSRRIRPKKDVHEVRFTLKDVEDSLEKFTAEKNENVEKWMENFEDVSETFSWNELQKFIYCKQLLQGTAKQFVSSENLNNFNSLKKALLKEFKKKG